MSIQDWAAIGEILGAIAVLLSLVYVGRQLKQTNSMARLDAGAGRTIRRANRLANFGDMTKPHRNTFTLHRFVCVVMIGLLVQVAVAQNADRERSAQERIDFVLGNVEFLLLHELAHFVIGEKHVQIIGPEENAADYLATIALIRIDPFDTSHQDQPLHFVLAAADAFSASWTIGTGLGAEIPYWDSHALSIQRYYQIACLIYGSDPVMFTQIPSVAALSEGRAENCVAEFERANQSVGWLLESYGRLPDDPAGAAVQVIYEMPRTQLAMNMLREIQSVELFEQTLQRMTDLFTLDQPMSVVMRNCDVSEAAWVPDQRELVVCYELIETIYLLSLREQIDQLSPVLP